MLALALLLTGCQGQPTDNGIPTAQSGTGGDDAATPTTAKDVMEGMRAWAQCMRDQGFDVPDPYVDPATGKPAFGFEGPGKGDPMEEQFVTAMMVCEPYETAYQEIGRQPFTDQQMALWLIYTQCVRDHGVEVADPDQASGIPPFPDPKKFRDHMALVEQAMRECQDEFSAARSAS